MASLHLLALLVIICHATLSPAQATCYGMEGGQLNSNYAPCNTGNSSTHSACCNAANADICLSSGLCLSTVAVALGRVLWVSGCTDKTLKDPTCPQYCRSLNSKNGATANSYFLRACDQNETVNSWCCGVAGQSMDDCCSRSFKLRSNIGDFVQQLSLGREGASSNGNSANANDGVPFATASLFNQPPLASSTASSSDSMSTSSPTPSQSSSRDGLIAGISVVSTIATAAIIALVVAILRIQHLKRRQAPSASDPPADDAASEAPQVVEQPAAQSTLPTNSRSPDITTSHELSPISATRSLNEISDTVTNSELRSVGMGMGEGSGVHSPVLIAELPAEAVLKSD
ncbi:hypothetical protein SBRCBS47491_009316 [Sporothrix bragantina]|uniref:Uncharacterized protein n=1 Tax=Sporothrix bragantina TaxID=671064 RepID=A0ABP0CWV7_9PEZI